MPYLSYDEYESMGGSLSESTFTDLERASRFYVNWVTFDRLKKYDTIPTEVKECMYELIRLLEQKMKALDIAPNGVTKNSDGSVSGVKSRSNDGVSVSYNSMSAKELASQISDEIFSTIDVYLQSVTDSLGRRLLYRGLYAGE